MESQAYALSSPLPGSGTKMVPIDFIGRLENIEADIARMLDQAAKHTGVRLGKATLQKVLRSISEASGRERPHGVRIRDTSLGDNKHNDLRSESIDAMVRQVYSQDFVCFGYE